MKKFIQIIRFKINEPTKQSLQLFRKNYKINIKNLIFEYSSLENVLKDNDFKKLNRIEILLVNYLDA